MKNKRKVLKIIICIVFGFSIITCDEIIETNIAITVIASSTEINRGDTANFSAIVTGINNIPQDVTWSIAMSIPDGTYEDPFILTENIWKEINTTNSEDEYWFSFTATSNFHYIHIKNTYSYIEIYDSYNNQIDGIDNYSNNYDNYSKYNYNYFEIGHIYNVKVYSYTGIYGIAFNTDINSNLIKEETLYTLPSGTYEEPFQLTENNWKEINSTNSEDEHWFKFKATSNYHYIHIINDTIYDYLYIKIQDAYNNIINEIYNYGNNSYSYSFEIDQLYYIIIYSNTSTYCIAFTTSDDNNLIESEEYTHINSDGILYVSKNETRATLKIQASSNFDKNITGLLTVNIILPTVDTILVNSQSNSISRGQSQTFNYTVSGTYDYPQDVIWSLQDFTPATGTKFDPILLDKNTWSNEYNFSDGNEQWFKLTPTSLIYNGYYYSNRYISFLSNTFTNLNVEAYDSYYNNIDWFNKTVNLYNSSCINIEQINSYFNDRGGVPYYIKISNNNYSTGSYRIAFYTGNTDNNITSILPPTHSYLNTNTHIDENGTLYIDPEETRPTITVKATSTWDRTKSGTATVNVEQLVNEVIVNPSSNNVYKGQNYNLNATVLGINNPPQDVIWSLSLNPGCWVDGEIMNNKELWFTFDVEYGYQHFIEWNDSNNYYLFLAFYSDGTIIPNSETHMSNTISFSPIKSDTLIIKVFPKFSNSTGTFSLVYTSLYYNYYIPNVTQINSNGNIKIGYEYPEDTIKVRAFSKWDNSVSGTTTLTVN